MAMEAAFAAMTERLAQTEAHTRQLSEQLDRLRAESSTAVTELRAQLEQSRAANAVPVTDRKKWSLLHAKNHVPKTFSGDKNDDFKAWVKLVKGYSNAVKSGYKKALEWAETSKEPILADELELMSWMDGGEADTNLDDNLMMTTTGDALRIVEAFEDRGFEAWRQLKLRYNPSGGRFQLDQMTTMLHRKPCKDVTELPAAIDKLEKDFRSYEQNSEKRFPEEWKIPLLRDLLPAAYKKRR